MPQRAAQIANLATTKVYLDRHPRAVKIVELGDLAPKFYPVVSSLLAVGLPCLAV
jgi:hypothetical protein